MRDQKGITLVTLMLTMIIIFILGAISVYTGIEAYKTIKVQNFIAQMRVVQERINLICEDWKNWDGYDESLTGTEANANFNTYIKEYLKEKNGGVELSTANLCGYESEFQTIIDAQTDLESNDTILSNYYYFSKEDLEKYLGLKDLEIDVIINFFTKTFIERTGVESINSAGDTQTYYILSDIIEAQRLTETLIQNIVKDNEISEYYKKLNLDIVENAGNSKTIGVFLNSKVELPVKKVEMTTGTYSNIEDTSISWDNVTNYVSAGGYVSVAVTKNGNYNFKITDSSGNIFYSKESINIELANMPNLESGMKPIIFSDGEILEVDTSDPEWCNYSATKKEWANVMLEDGSIYVWIPRFAYLIKDGDILIKFIEGSSSSAISDGDSIDGYEIHPAFKSSTSYENGEWNQDVSGIWVAKFNANISGREEKLITTYGKKITKVKDFYKALTLCRDMQQKSYYGFSSVSSVGLKNDLTYGGTFSYDTHLIKNSEMGALLYLTWSDFGLDERNVSCNKTGISGGYETEYSVFNNGAYSNTGNAYGVYDIIKSEGEYVAAGISKIKDNSDVANVKKYYLTLYNNTSGNNAILGDGIKELRSWLTNAESTYPTTDSPVFIRGFSQDNMFSYKNAAYENDEGYYIRPVIIVKE